MLILIPTIAFWTGNPKSTFGQIWTEKVKAFCFAWKLAHMHMHTQDLEDVDSYFDISFSTSNLNLEDADSYSEFSEIPNLNQFFGQIWVEKFEFSTLPGSWYTEYLADVIVIIQSKFWRKRWQWIIILSACCSHIFIVAKSKKQNHSTKECWINGIIVAIKIFLSKAFCFNQNL